MDALQYTIDGLIHKQYKTITRSGMGDTEEGIGFAQVLYGEYIQIFTKKLEEAKAHKHPRGKPRSILKLPVEKLTALALNAGISALCGENNTLAYCLRGIGLAVWTECYGQALEEWNSDEKQRLEAIVKSKHSSVKQRRAALRAYASKLGPFVFDLWTDQEKVNAGKWLLEGLLDGPAFALDSEQRLTLTDAALAQLDEVTAAIVMRRLVGLPVPGELPAWDSSTLHIDSLPYPLIRSYQKPVKAHVDKAVRNGQAARVLEALNHIQAVRWRINQPVLALVRHCYDKHIGIPGLPPAKDLPKPEKPMAWEDMTEGQRKAWKRKASEVATINRSFIGERIILSRDLAIADTLGDSSWAIPHNLDYRGRVYGIPHFQFQRQDHIRALFMFDQGQTLDADGLYWLKVHVANTGDFNKVSKQDFDSRVWWTDDNVDRLIATAANPLADLWWREADKPFMFVAACMALKDALEGLSVHIPVSFDGSCSGIQHLASMSLCEDTGSLVNLTASKKPSDIYQTVADVAKRKIETDLTSTKVLTLKNICGEGERSVNISDLARLLLDYGVTRSLVKRNVMTYSYSSRRAGMQQQILEDTMRPLQLQVLAGEIDKHPLGDDGGFAAARYLSGITYDSIVETVHRPAEVMKYLQRVAGVMAHEEKPTVWTTPLGLPVMLRCPNTETECINLFLHDKGVKVRLQPRTMCEVGGIDRRKSTQAVAPSFVHSMDACHLMMVVLEAKQQGINNVALVHDSFGCLPNDAARFRQLIKETFVKLYTENNPLEQIKQENCVHLVTHGYRLPDLPTKGSLQIEEVLHAEYAFA